jgi:flagellar biosynthetic protein FliR
MDFSRVAAFGLMLARPGMIIGTAPAFGGAFAPPHVRIGLTMLLAVTMAPTVALPPVGSSTALTLVVMRELAIGLAIGLSMRALIAGAEMAGHLTATQIGFTYGAVVDPQSGVRNNILAVLYANLALVTFLAIDGHHALIRALASSYEALPIGVSGVDASLVQAVTDMLGVVFVLGVRFAMPVIIVLLVVELAMGLISRTAPLLNLLVVAMPIRLVIGLLVVLTVVPATPGVVRRFAAVALDLGAALASAFR